MRSAALVIEEEFWKIDPVKLFVIFEHKVDIARQVIRAGGRKLKIEGHGGTRKRAKAAIVAAMGVAED